METGQSSEVLDGPDPTTPVIVFVDIPDSDNILMIIQILRDFPDQHVQIVLSPRPVDFSVPRYGQDWDRLKEAVGIQKMLMPIKDKERPDWVPEDPDLSKWFDRDKGFESLAVCKDTKLYMRVSAFRFAELLNMTGIPPSRYTFYWDTKSMNPDKIRPGLRHAFHAPDFAYGFDKEDRDKYSDICNKATEPSRSYHNQVRRVCESYVGKMVQKYATLLARPEREIRRCILQRFDKLVKRNNKEKVNPILVVGGPFTEVLAYSKEAPVHSVVAMGGFIHGGTNIFPNQFNFHVDVNSAKEFLERAKSESIRVTLVPTECIKGSVFELTEDELSTIMKNAQALYWMTRLYYHQSSGGMQFPAAVKAVETDSQGGYKYRLFDWIAAVVVTFPTLFPTRRVRPFYEMNKDDVEIIKFAEDEEGHIVMCWDDEECMLGHKEQLKEKLTFPAIQEPANGAALNGAALNGE